MNNPRVSYLNISPYSRHSPNLQIKTELKKHSSSLERPKSTKIQYAGATTRGQIPINNNEMMDRKFSPFGNKKVDLMASLYHMGKTKQGKEKTGTPKLFKSRDVQVKKSLKNNSRNSDKMNEKLAIYQYISHKPPKKSEESKILQPSIQYIPSRHGSKSQIHDEKEFSQERKLLEASIIQQRQLLEAMEEAQKAKIKQNAYAQNQNNLALFLKSAQKSSQNNLGKGSYVGPPLSIMSLNKGSDDRQRMNNNPNADFVKEFKMGMNFYQDISQPRVKLIVERQENEIPNKKHHRRGLSSGQNPIYIEQQLAMEKLAMEQERQERLRQQQQMQIQQQLQHQLQQQMFKQQQLQMQQQYRMMKDPQQEEDEYYEEFFHMDKMTFDFERLIIAQKITQSQLCTPTASPMNKKTPSHSRTKSIEEPNSLLPTKSTSRWTTKRSSIGDEYHQGGGNGRDHFNLIEQISDLDKTDEKEDNRKFYKMSI